MTLISVWFYSLWNLWKFASVERPSRAHQARLFPLLQDELLLLVPLQRRLCRPHLQVSCARALPSSLLESCSQCLAYIHLACCSTPTPSGLFHHGHGRNIPLCCSFLCVWSWIPCRCILDQCFGDNILHQLGAPRLSERQWKATAVQTLPATANKLPTLSPGLSDGTCSAMLEMESPFGTGPVFSLAGWEWPPVDLSGCCDGAEVALLSSAAQPAAHANLRFSSYPVSEHTATNHV